jgi:putative FmdB family regulatory protein
MPTYEYGCTECGNEWEEVQRITAPPIEVCPKCGKTSAHRLISAGTNFILKGGGWYSDLYSSSGGSKKTDESAKPASGETKTAAAKPSEPSTPTPTTPTTPTTPPTSAAA